MRIIVNGANGAMGKYVLEAVQSGRFDTEAAAVISRSFETDASACRFSSPAECTVQADCVIDFSNHEGTAELTQYCVRTGTPVIIATTGHSKEELKLIREASSKIPVFLASNTSIGVAVVCELVKKAAAAFPDADIEIIERHHNRKADAPIGTALTIAENIREVRKNAEFVYGRSGHAKRQPNEIGIHAVRYGNEVGTHEIIISTGMETVTVKHESETRALFADGAIKAAFFLCGKPAGLYSMPDMMNE